MPVSCIWEDKIFRNIFGPVKENGLQRIRTNQELKGLYTEIGIVSEIS